MSTFYGYSNDLVSKDYVDKIDERVVNKAGFLRTDINMGARLINRNTVPILDTELVNKKYVDDKFKKVSFFRQWEYPGLSRSVKYPRVVTNGYPSFPIALHNISENASITVYELISDNDGGGLNSGDDIEFYIRYTIHDGTNPQTSHEQLMFTVQLSNYTKYTINDQQGALYCFALNKDYDLNQITNYNHIKLLYVGIKQSAGTVHGNECCLIVNYNDPK